VKIGDIVTYKNSIYYIVGGPTNGADGPTYDISTTPPPVLGVKESELEALPEGGEFGEDTRGRRELLG
jgi:hypothetical protein